MRRVLSAFIAAIAAAVWFEPAHGLGRPGLTPVACPSQEWETAEPALRSAARRESVRGALRRRPLSNRDPREVEWRADAQRPRVRVEHRRERLAARRRGRRRSAQHLIDEGFAWAASSYRCNGYVPGHRASRTRWRLTDLFTKFNGGTAPAPRLSHGHLDGRTRHASRHARVPDVVCRRSRDVSGRTRAVRLLHRHRRGRGSDHRGRAEKTSHTYSRISRA